jgi:hypothetical protein
MISSCNFYQQEQIVFPKVKNVKELAKTDFVPTLETSFDTELNNIYGVTIPLAWQEIKKEIRAPITHFSCTELEELNSSKGFINALQPEEYETTIEINGDEITAKAIFKKSLPFKEPMTKFVDGLKFDKSEVESFGFWGNCRDAKLNYFQNENNFSISLFPRNEDHEIILIMNHGRQNRYSNFSDFLKVIDLAKNQNVYFNDIDKVQIPIIEFNLEHDFDQLIGCQFRSDISDFQVAKVYQRNAFILDEKGAAVESEAEISVEEAEEVLVKPRIMIFNKPFVIFLKRKDSDNPYFGVYIANDELLKKI